MAFNNLYLIAPLLVFLAGLVPLLLLKDKYKLKRRIFVWGATAWSASILVKMVFASFFNVPLYNVLNPISPYLFYIYVGLLTGIFEIFIPLYIILRLKKNFKDRNSQLGFGLSFGAFEAIVLGLINIILFLMILSASVEIPEEYLFAYSQSTEYYVVNGLYAAVERLSAIAIHIFGNMLIFLYVFKKKLQYLLSSIVYKTFVDTMATFFIGVQSPTMYIEAFYLALAVATILYMQKFLRIKLL